MSILLLWTSLRLDSVRHHTLISKMSSFAVPDSFHNWLADYLFSRTHQTTVLENKSTFLPITTAATTILLYYYYYYYYYYSNSYYCYDNGYNNFTTDNNSNSYY